MLLDESATDITVLSHFGRPDDDLHELGRHQVLVIVQGPHDYVSPSWYPPSSDQRQMSAFTERRVALPPTVRMRPLHV